jgi:hypothetical protein
VARASKGARRIVVDGVAYRWRVSVWNTVTQRYGPSTWQRASLSFWPELSDRARGRASVASTEVGYVPGSPGFGIGPKLVSDCIRKALALGWAPDQGGEFPFDAGMWSFVGGTKAPTLDYQIRVHGELVSVRSLAAPELLSCWLAREHISCCTLRGGFHISADGKHWNQQPVDEIRMSTTWVGAIECLMAGGNVADIWAWEQSHMMAIRHGELVELFDDGTWGYACPRVFFPLGELARQFADVMELAGALFDAVLRDARLHTPRFDHHRAVLEDNLPRNWPAKAVKLRERAGAPTPTPRSPEPPPPVAHVAILLGDTPTLRGDVAMHGVDQAFRGQLLLQTAVDAKREDMVEYLLAAGADPNSVAKPGRDPALVHAIYGASLSIVEMLVRAGADVNFTSKSGVSVLQLAAQRRELRPDGAAIFTCLRNAGARYTLPVAVAIGDLQGAMRLLEPPLQPELSALCIERIIAADADETPSWRELLTRLAAAGADLRPALRESIAADDPELVRLVLQLGARPDDIVRDPHTALQLARRDNRAAAAAVLEQAI